MLWEKDSKQKTVMSTRCSICYGRKMVNRRLSCLPGAAYVMGERWWIEDCHVYPVQNMLWEKDGKQKTVRSTRCSICYGRKMVNRRLSCLPGAAYVMGERRWIEDCHVYPVQNMLWEKDSKQKTQIYPVQYMLWEKDVNRRLSCLPSAVYVMGERQ